MKPIKIDATLTPKEIKEKIILLESKLREYIRILGLIIVVVLVELGLLVFTSIQFDYLPIILFLFCLFIINRIWRQIDRVTLKIVIYRALNKE